MQIIFQDIIKDAQVLIDTGSRVDLLIQTSLFPKEALCQARHPISIRTADGFFMEGGSLGSFVSLRMPIRDTMSGDVTYVQFDDVWAYAADITNDVILGFPFLCRGSLSVDCSTLTLRSALTNTPTTCHSLGRCSQHGEAHTPIDSGPREVRENPELWGHRVGCKLLSGHKPDTGTVEELATKTSVSNVSATRMTLERPALDLIIPRGADIPPVTNNVSQLDEEWVFSPVILGPGSQGYPSMVEGTGRGSIPDKAVETASLVDVQVKSLLPDFISVELFTGNLPVLTTPTTPTTKGASEDGSIITDKRMLKSEDTKVLDVGRISHIMIPKVCPLHTSFKRTHTAYVASATLDSCWNSWDPKYPERVGLTWILLDPSEKPSTGCY